MGLRKNYVALLVSSLLALSVRLAAQDMNAAATVFPPAGHTGIMAKSWSLIGPFAVEGGDASGALVKEYPPDKVRDFYTRYPGEDGNLVCWSWCPEPNAIKILLSSKGSIGKPCVFFAASYIESPASGRVSFALRSDVPAKAWVNGSAAGEFRPGSTAVFSAELKSGVNELLVKCIAEKTGSGFSVAVDNAIKGLVFTGHSPLPISPVPVSAWRCASVDPGGVEDLKAVLLKNGEVGIPRQSQAGREIGWTEPNSSPDGSLIVSGRSPSDTVFLVGHIFSPIKFHDQGRTFKLFCPEGTGFYIDGRKLGGSRDVSEKQFSARGFAHEMRVGLNRMVVEIPPGADGASVRLLTGNPGDVKFLAELPPGMDPAVHVGDWTSTVITNGIVTATVAVPDLEKGYYRGNRFEQAGIITKLERDGHSFFLDAPSVHSPLNAHECCGPCEEWFEAIAYDDARPGEPFIKLGVGLYEKPYHPGHLWGCAYWPIRMFPWTTKAEKDRIEFVQEVDAPRGWGYRYVKRLVLVPGRPVLLIEHSLTNTGRNRIDAEQYAHNFISLDRRPVGKGLKVSFTFPPKTSADISKIGAIEGSGLVVTADKVETQFVPLEGWAPDARDVAATITMPGVAAGIRIGGDFTVSKLGVFISTGQISCEPFVKVSLEPGAATSWTRSYEFLLDGAEVE
ncbi:MAG: hypothetical protein WAX69_02045 [Victivallales bacterium]